MASKNLPTSLTGGESGHPGLHNDSHEVVNLFDYDAWAGAADGHYAIDVVGGLITPGADQDSAAGGGAEMGIRYVDATGGSDSNDGFTAATAKATIQGAINSMSGGRVLVRNQTHLISSTIADNGKNIIIQGQSPQGTLLQIESASIGPTIHLTGRGSGVQDLRIAPNPSIIAQSGYGGILLQAKNTWIDNVHFWNIARDLTTGLQVENPDAPYCVKVMAPDTTEATYPTHTSTQLSDWVKIRNCYFFQSYRGIVMLIGTNVDITNCNGDIDRGAWLYAERGAPLLNTWGTVMGCHFVGNPDDHATGTRDEGYTVYLRSADTPTFMGMKFIGVRHESFGSGPAHVFCDTTDNQWHGCSAGGTGGNLAVIEFGPDGNDPDNIVMPFFRSSSVPNNYINASAVTAIATTTGLPST